MPICSFPPPILPSVCVVFLLFCLSLLFVVVASWSDLRSLGAERDFDVVRLWKRIGSDRTVAAADDKRPKTHERRKNTHTTNTTTAESHIITAVSLHANGAVKIQISILISFELLHLGGGRLTPAQIRQIAVCVYVGCPPSSSAPPAGSGCPARVQVSMSRWLLWLVPRSAAAAAIDFAATRGAKHRNRIGR